MRVNGRKTVDDAISRKNNKDLREDSKSWKQRCTANTRYES